ncbi:MAG: hypothetical protein JNK36_09645 [Bacteroidia bacterium]|nr:hypothetical protein [Bacteroidia bacterium]MBP7713633.1 hypothetical protein [Bacteroidia bacterium]MBP8667439.1 hypothetical protein [Bacteroidia bacterium]HQW16783.1 hypothetical protein [Bacteroidia bacterium]HQW48186.1 hypothetical protein [Bacteroidia bacterium]
MRKVFFILIIFIATLSDFSLVQAQTVNEKFDRLDLSENFDTSSGMWTFMSNSENLFLVQEGEYILNRKAPEKPYAIIANYDYNQLAFKMVTSLKIEKANDQNGSVGVMFMAQNDGNGGFIFEINTLKQFRLRQIVAGSYKYLTGDAKSGGWVKSNFINNLNVYNLFELKFSQRNYDIYLNNNLLMSFTEIAYKNGRFGYIVGPGSRAKIDFLYLFSASGKGEPTAGSSNNNQQQEGSPDVIQLAESIIKLKTQINKLQAENEELTRNLENVKTADQEDENERKLKDKTITDLQKQMTKKEASFDSLLKVNQTLQKYKEMVAGNENSDLIITLSKSVKAEKEKNKQLTDSLQILKTELMKQKGAKATPPVEKKEPQKVNTEFTLPKEN